MNGIPLLTLSRLLEGVLLWCSGLVFFSPLPRRDGWTQKTVIFLLVGILLGFVLHVSAPQIFLLALVGLLYLFLYGLVCCQTGKSVILYCGIWGIQMHILVYELCRFASFSSSVAGASENALVMRVVISAALYLAAGFTVQIWLPIYQRQHVGPRQTTSAVLLFVIFVALTYGFFHGGQFRLQGILALVLVMAQFYCLIVLDLQAALFQESAVRQERDMIELLYRKQKSQYEQSKESIAIINQKTHDLKHMLAAMRTMEGSEQRERYLREIQSNVDIYDSMVKTGNETLDTVLTEKSLYCNAHDIVVTCVADGACLRFMDPVDIYTLMGNAMDNAIEAVQQFRRKELRTIDVVVYRRQSLVLVSITNPLEEELVFEDGIPRSTKPQDGYHGFGVRSMRSTVRRYGGELTVDTRDGCFTLKMVFPL